MQSLLNSLKKWLLAFGFHPKDTLTAILKLPKYFRDKKTLNKQKISSNVNFQFGGFYPCLFDEEDEGGNAKGHYFHQDLLVARKIFLVNPKKHVDVGSRIDGFVSHVASFREIEIFDIRDIKTKVPNIKFIKTDLMKDLDKSLYYYTNSLSCLHTLEHFGLGRYGDKVKYDGYLDGFENLYKILNRGGKFYFSVPIGPQRIEFNAHRVFSVKYLLDLILPKYQIDSFSYVDDKGDLIENAELTKEAIENNFGCFYGCGIFELTKL
ncbi:MAG: DUF268 domain-containing protein [Bacteroidetes bacterium]|nr:DUF268 domain-containing protein [Bacteroidota bacterium]